MMLQKVVDVKISERRTIYQEILLKPLLKNCSCGCRGYCEYCGKPNLPNEYNLFTHLTLIKKKNISGKWVRVRVNVCPDCQGRGLTKGDDNGNI